MRQSAVVGTVMASPITIAAYLLAFLILIVHAVDAVIQWRHPREKSKTYFAVQLFVVISIAIIDIILVAYHETKGKEATLHALQGFSLLQSLVFTAMLALRIRIGKKPLLRFQDQFPWVSSAWGNFTPIFCLVSLVVLGVFCTAMGFILCGDNDDRYLVFVGFATITALCFPVSFALVRIDALRALEENESHFQPRLKSSVATSILTLNLLTLPASVLPQLLPGVTGFLLGQNFVCLYSNCLWVSLMFYSFEIRRKKDSYPTRNDHEQRIIETQASSKWEAGKSSIRLADNGAPMSELGAGECCHTKTMYLPPDAVIEGEVSQTWHFTQCKLSFQASIPVQNSPQVVFDRSLDALLSLTQVPSMAFCLWALARMNSHERILLYTLSTYSLKNGNDLSEVCLARAELPWPDFREIGMEYANNKGESVSVSFFLSTWNSLFKPLPVAYPQMLNILQGKRREFRRKLEELPQVVMGIDENWLDYIIKKLAALAGKSWMEMVEGMEPAEWYDIALGYSTMVYRVPPSSMLSVAGGLKNLCMEHAEKFAGSGGTVYDFPEGCPKTYVLELVDDAMLSL